MSESYFREYTEATADVGQPDEVSRPTDNGGQTLAFGHLDDRTFEVLAWRIKREEVGADRARLMQGTGERGRDVVVYAVGRVETIVQCKLLRTRMDKPDVVRELLKVALHSVLDPDVLGERTVRYELWAPGGFTEPASDLLLTWPRGWTEDEVQKYFEAVRSRFTAFGELTWAGVRNAVVGQFPERLAPAVVDAHEVTVQVRAAPAVHDDFFVVMRAANFGTLASFMSQRGLRAIADADVRYLVDRIEANAKERRHGTPFGFLLGIPEPLLGAMSHLELLGLIEGPLMAAMQTLTILTDATSRCISGYVFSDDRLSEAVPRRTALAVLQSALVLDAMKALVRLTPSGDAAITDRYRVYEGTDLWGRIEHSAGLWWDDLSAVIDRGAPTGEATIREDGAESDDALRYRLSDHCLDEYGSPSRIEFVQAVLSDLRKADTAVTALDQRARALVPEDVIVVSDLRFFSAPTESMSRFSDAFRNASIRGSAQDQPDDHG